MDEEKISSFAEKEAELENLVKSETVNAVNEKIQSLKTENDADKLKSYYDELIHEVLQERSKAVMLAQMYKYELENIVISDKDIEHLQKTIGSFFEILIQSYMIEADPEDEEQMKEIKSYQNGLNALSCMINADTIKTLHLMGFDYKEAVGRPLTEVCARAIRESLDDSIIPGRSETEIEETIKQPLIVICTEAIKHFFGSLKGGSDKGGKD